jgi:hypothetical protein
MRLARPRGSGPPTGHRLALRAVLALGIVAVCASLLAASQAELLASRSSVEISPGRNVPSTSGPPSTASADPQATLRSSGSAIAATPTSSPQQDPVLVGAGDICEASHIASAKMTATLIQGRPTAQVFTVGDNSNDVGSASNYTNCYAPSWGRFLSRTRATVGNHDYMTDGGAPYYAYFGAAAGPAGLGYYSYDLANNWHVIVLNSQCSQVHGCKAGSPEEKWLRNDLAASTGKHIIAMWHIPAFSSGEDHGNNPNYLDWWADLFEAHADLILNGHDHDYERFALQSPAGVADANGIREFVIGTGGAGQRPFGQIRANSQVRHTGTYGVLVLTLRAHGYDWLFQPVAGESFTDSGTQATHT